MTRSTWGILAAIAFACGGKTDILDETGTGSGGSAGSTQGSGGTSGTGGVTGRGGTAGGSAGRGGTLGRGGSPGIPGTGGGAGMGGGTGGAVTGGAGGAGGAGSAVQLIEAICRHYETHGCGAGIESCRTTLTNNYNTNELWGCGDEWLLTQSCSLNDPTPCGGSEFCAEGFAIHQKCIDEAEICIRGNHTTGGCVIGCEGWGADCQPSPNGLACRCTSGSRPGSRFETSAACQSEEWLNTVRASCQ